MLPLLAHSKGLSYSRRVLNTAPIMYYPLNELSGVVAYNYGTLGPTKNGVYTGTTLAQMAAPGGGLAPLFDGVDDVADTAMGLDPQEGSVSVYAKVLDASVWTDGLRHCIYGWYCWDDNSFSIFLQYTGNLVGYQQNLWNGNPQRAVVTSTLSWFHCVATWSALADEMLFYFNGVPVDIGLPFYSLAPAPEWDGYHIGYGYPGFFKGFISHVAIWDRPITPSEVTSLYIGGA